MDIPGYQIEHEIGRGGMATVYAAIQTALERRVALKVIHYSSRNDGDFTQRFIREGRIGAKLHHPHIVTIFEYGTYNDCHFLSMEYFPGGTLSSRIRQGLTLGQTMSIVTTIADALAYAHHLHLIHRDVKPSNILFRRDESPVLTDFGIARLEDDSEKLTATGKTLGTVYYMSPEQIRGDQLDNRSDLYSLGVVFYQMLTGRFLYDGENFFDIAKQHVSAEIPKLPDMINRFQPILERLLAKNRHERFSSAEQLIQAFNAVAHANIPQRIHAPPRPGSTPKRSRTSRTAIFAGAGVLIVAASATAVIMPNWLARQNLQEAEQLLAQAQRYYDDGQLTDTLAILQNGLAIAPTHTQLLALRDKVQATLTERRQADQYFKEAAEFYDNNRLEDSLAAVEKGLVLMSDHAELLKLQKRIHDAMDKRQEATTLLRQIQEPQNNIAALAALIEQAKQLHREGQRAESLALIAKGLRLDPEQPELLELLAAIALLPAETTVPDATPSTPVAQQLDLNEPKSPDISNREQQIQTLLEKAEQQLSQHRLTSPPGDNAFESYQMILTLDPFHPAVEQGYDKIATAYLALAEEAFAGNPEQSLDYIESGLQAVPHHRSLLALKEKILATHSTEAILQQAQIRYENGRLFEPEGDNAFDFFLQVLNRDTENTAAKAGLIRTFQKFFNQLDKQPSSRKQQKTTLDDIMALVEKALAVAPQYDKLLNLRTDIEARQAEIATTLHDIDQLMALAKAQAQAGKVREPPSDNACDSYRQVLQLDPNHTGAKELLIAADCSAANPEVERLLAIAERQLQQKKLTTPKGDNAYETYQTLLQLAPYHPQVKAGFDNIAERYRQLAEQERRSPSNRWDLIRKGLQVAPEHSGLLALRDQIKPLITKRLINRGWSNLKEFYWDTAIDSFQQVLELDPDNTEGQRGLIATANALIRFPGDYDGAYSQYLYVLKLHPDHQDATRGLLTVQKYYSNRLARAPDNATIREKLAVIDAILKPASTTAANDP